jgi:hypothetical protein
MVITHRRSDTGVGAESSGGSFLGPRVTPGRLGHAPGEGSDPRRRNTILAIAVTVVAILVGGALVAIAMRVGEVTVGSEGSTTSSLGVDSVVAIDVTGTVRAGPHRIETPDRTPV